MEKKINTSVNNHFRTFKDKFKTLLMSDSFNVLTDDLKSELLGFVYDYNSFEITKTILDKRKRVKNIVPLFNRCCAKRADNAQCTRRRKSDEQFCGTHAKSTPHGTVDDVVIGQQNSKTKHNVWAQDIKGIVYYIDAEKNVYDPDDILKSTINPKIIAKWSYNEMGDTCIA
jgi:hypothetical protein